MHMPELSHRGGAGGHKKRKKERICSNSIYVHVRVTGSCRTWPLGKKKKQKRNDLIGAVARGRVVRTCTPVGLRATHRAAVGGSTTTLDCPQCLDFARIGFTEKKKKLFRKKKSLLAVCRPQGKPTYKPTRPLPNVDSSSAAKTKHLTLDGSHPCAAIH